MSCLEFTQLSIFIACHILVFHTICLLVVNNGQYIQAVCDSNLAENISRVLYPNDNVCAPMVIIKSN